MVTDIEDDTLNVADDVPDTLNPVFTTVCVPLAEILYCIDNTDEGKRRLNELVGLTVASALECVGLMEAHTLVPCGERVGLTDALMLEGVELREAPTLERVGFAEATTLVP